MRRRLTIFLTLALLILAAVYLKFSPGYWNGKDKLSLVVADGADIEVAVYDPINTEITTFVIPGDTQVIVAQNKGVFKIKNVWQLGVDEGVGGRLLAETVTKNFDFPVFLWRKEAKTNLSPADRLSLFLFKFKIKDGSRNTIDLGKAMYVKKQKLEDGSWGYVLESPTPERLTVYFSDYQLASQQPRVLIKDVSGSYGISQKVGRIIEVMGGKVVSIQRGDRQNTDCEIGGKNKEVVDRLSVLFSCDKTDGLGEFDIEIRLGESFAKRY